MTITVTKHEALSRDILGAQVGDKITIAAGQVSAVDALENGFYRIKAMADCIVRIGDADLANASDGEDWHEGDVEVRVISDGQRIAVDPAA